MSGFLSKYAYFLICV